MEEEKVKEKSVLNQGEIDFVAGLIPEGEEGAQDRIFVGREKGLLGEQRFRKVWDAWQNGKRKGEWENVLNTIKEIPEDRNLSSLMMANFPGKPYVSTIAWVSMAMLFKCANTHLSVTQMKSVDQVLRRINSDGNGLGDEPWKGLLFVNAENFPPANVKEIVKAVTEVGIDEDKYVRVIWERAVEILSDDEMLSKELKGNDDSVKIFFEIVMYVDEYIHGQKQLHAQRILEISDILLSQGYIYAACNAYKMIKQQNFPIDDTRKRIIEIGRRYAYETSFTREKAVKQIKKVIAKSGLAIEIK